MSTLLGVPITRVDGKAKVTGTAQYAAELDLPNLAYAALVLSTIPKGIIERIDTRSASGLPGVHTVITHLNAPELPYRALPQRPAVDPKSGDQLHVFQNAEILFCGQPIAVVVADTPEQARYAATLVRVTYATTPAATQFDVQRARPPSPETIAAGRPAETARGDADRMLEQAAIKVDVRYVQPREHHNAIEPHATVASSGKHGFTLHDKTQWVYNDRTEIAHVFGLAEEDVHVVSPYVGGAFGSALRTWPHVTIAALAARQTGRPVCLELTRRELYTSVGFRPHTEQRVALGADATGKLTAIVQEAEAQTSSYEEYAELVLDPPRMMYSCANVRTRYRLVEMDTNSPCPMRGPGYATGSLALEMAIDELAVAGGFDPLELRVKNFARHNEHSGLPWSSNELLKCYEIGAERFGWRRRQPAPRSMREGDMLIGYGMAAAVYPAHRAKASAKITLLADGTALVASAASDMGPGTYTSMTQVAADALGLPTDKVRCELGDTALPYAPVHGGSITMASVGCAVKQACEALNARAEALAARLHLDGSTASGNDDASARYTRILRSAHLDYIDATADAGPGEEEKTLSSCAFGAVFAEVWVDARLSTIKVARLIGAYDVGRVINPLLARSQCLGGMVGGIGMALLEQADWDPRYGRVMNANLAEYLVPVDADVNELDVIFVPGEDRQFNPLGAKGRAEIAICGVAPAIANAIYHATGKRVRELPITLEKLLD